MVFRYPVGSLLCAALLVVAVMPNSLSEVNLESLKVRDIKKMLQVRNLDYRVCSPFYLF